MTMQWFGHRDINIYLFLKRLGMLLKCFLCFNNVNMVFAPNFYSIIFLTKSINFISKYLIKFTFHAWTYDIHTHTLLLVRLKSAGSRFKTTAYTSEIYIRTFGLGFFTLDFSKDGKVLELMLKTKCMLENTPEYFWQISSCKLNN